MKVIKNKNGEFFCDFRGDEILWTQSDPWIYERECDALFVIAMTPQLNGCGVVDWRDEYKKLREWAGKAYCHLCDDPHPKDGGSEQSLRLREEYQSIFSGQQENS